MINIDLFYNLALLIFVVVIIDLIMRHGGYFTRNSKIILGMVIGGATILGMMNAVSVAPGVFFDGRSVLISAGAFIGGPVIALISSVIAIIFRISLGGDGVLVGSSVIVWAALAGLAYYYLRQRYSKITNPLLLLAFSLIVHAGMLGLMLALPGGISSTVISEIAFPVLTIFPIAGLIVCLLFLDQESYYSTISQLSLSEHKLKTALEAIQESSEKLRLHTQNSPLATIEWDADFIVTRWEGAAPHIFGWGASETIGKSVYDLNIVYEPDAPIVEQTIKTLKEGISSQVVTLNRNYTKDGRVIHCTWYNSALYDSNNKMISMMSQVEDSTEHERIETALAENEKHYRELYEQSPAGYQSLDQNGVFIEVNRLWLDTLGYQKEEVIGHWFGEFVASEDLDKFKKNFPRFVKAGHTHVDFKMKRKDGQIIIVAFEGRIAYTPKGEFKQTHCIIQDITERYKAEETTREHKERYEALFNSNNDAILVHQPQGELTPGTFIEANDAAITLLGYNREELLKLSPFDITKNDNMSSEPVKRTMESLRQTGKVQNERIFIHKDRHEIPVEINARLFKYKGIDTVITIVHDITTRKQAEAALTHAAEEWRTTFDSIKDMIAIVDPKHTILRVNLAFANALGFKPNDLVGKHCYEVIHGMNQPHPMCPHARTLQSKHVESSEYYDKKLKLWVEASSSPIFDNKGDLTGSVHVIKDISKRKQEELQQQQLRNKAEMSSRLAAVGEMAAGIAHEINNPLTGVIGFSELLLERKDLPDDVKDNLQIINEGSQRAREIIKRMLTFARQSTPQMNRVDITSLIDHTLELRNYVLATANIKVIKDYDANLPWVIADPGQLQQVFLNLIVNAEHAMKKAHDKGILTIQTKSLGDSIRISVADDGPGMPDEVLKKLFQPFFTTKEPGEGTGLGLSLSLGIIQEHNGTIRAESKAGKGTTFIVELPAAADADATGEIPPAAEPQKTITKANILVVDDEPAIRLLIKTILSQNGHTVEECDDPRKALDKIISADYNVILLDIRMPGMSGIELFNNILVKKPALSQSVIFITGDTSDEATKTYLEAHQTPYISKPFNRKTLETAVGEILGKKP
jgi:PAS domain S-box-containing protein